MLSATALRIDESMFGYCRAAAAQAYMMHQDLETATGTASTSIAMHMLSIECSVSCYPEISPLKILHFSLWHCCRSAKIYAVWLSHLWTTALSCSSRRKSNLCRQCCISFYSPAARKVHPEHAFSERPCSLSFTRLQAALQGPLIRARLLTDAAQQAGAVSGI